MRLVSMAVRDELVAAIAERYGASLRWEKARILDEFAAVTGYHRCRIADVEFTRCRPYHKNDQAWVEQKNGSVVRRMVGYRSKGRRPRPRSRISTRECGCS